MHACDLRLSFGFDVGTHSTVITMHAIVANASADFPVIFEELDFVEIIDDASVGSKRKK